MSAAKLQSKRSFWPELTHLPQQQRETAPSAALTALQLPQHRSIELVPDASSVTQTERISPSGDAASSLQEELPDPDLRWLGSLICMATAFASASAIVWILL